MSSGMEGNEARTTGIGGKGMRSLIAGTGLAAVIVAAAVFSLGASAGSGPGTHQLRILFPSADGMVNGSDVLEAGTRVGYISEIQPTQSNHALVTITINGDHWPLHRGLQADIRPKSLLGEKYVDLHDGPQTAGPYDASAVLKAPSNAVPVELDQFINSLDPPTRTAVRVLLDDLGGGLAGRGNDLNQAIAAGKADLQNLAVFGKTLNDRDPDLDRILVGLDGILSKITTNDQLTQMSQLITNGQNTLNDIEQVQSSFSRGFNDASAALSDLNTAIGGALTSLRSTINVAPSLVANLQQEGGLLAALGQQVNTSQNRSPNGECTSSTVADQPISTITGLQQCSPLWMLIAGLLGGPTNTSGSVETTSGGHSSAVFRACILIQPNLLFNPDFSLDYGCNTLPGAQPAMGGFIKGESATFASFLRS
jgi:phospholipid/cholesterol/gamma-HCH transport system substrate-binding protein